jgi:Na+/H+-dicarboxylate symporter
MSGLSAMDTKASGRLGVLTITYYLWTTFIAVIVGIILVLVIHPGTGTEKDGHRGGSGPVMTSADALLDLIRYICTQASIYAHTHACKHARTDTHTHKGAHLHIHMVRDLEWHI